MEFIILMISVIMNLIFYTSCVIFSVLFISDLINLILFAFRKKPFYHDIIWIRSIVVDHQVIKCAYGVVNLIDNNGYTITYKDKDSKIGVIRITKERMIKLIELQKIYYRFKIFRPHIYFKLV
jgi:hypothetical protein